MSGLPPFAARRCLRTLAAVAASIALASNALSSNALSQDWPTRPIKIIVASAAGSGPDSLARYVGGRLAKVLGQSVIIDNRPGANSVIGTQAAARSAPDGYNFALATGSSFSVNRHTIKALPYDPSKDFDAVVLLATGGLAVIADPRSGITRLPDIVAADKREPGRLSVATEGPVAGAILAYLNTTLGTKLVQIPHTNAAMAMQDVMSGRTALSVASVIVALPFIKSGAVRPVAVITPERDPSLPEVPTIGETSPGFGVNAWAMFVAPAGTPAAIVERVNAETNRILKDPEVRAWMLRLGNRAEGGSSAQAAAFLRSDLALWEKIAHSAGIKPE